MNDYQFNTTIKASAEKVWNTMLGPETYKQWIAAAWPGSFFEGKWKKGEKIRFLSPKGGGTVALLTAFEPYHLITAKHVAVVSPDGSEETTSEDARSWIGSTENYVLEESGGITKLTVNMQIDPSWAGMFDEAWPKGLAALKALCES
ncbi:MAG TPA: SRPBCC domain-containing protein [Chitinophagaceae bacterium]|jgi:uncharacterized protein YndB with AHSA1/START domain